MHLFFQILYGKSSAAANGDDESGTNVPMTYAEDQDISSESDFMFEDEEDVFKSHTPPKNTKKVHKRPREKEEEDEESYLQASDDESQDSYQMAEIEKKSRRIEAKKKKANVVESKKPKKHLTLTELTVALKEAKEMEEERLKVLEKQKEAEARQMQVDETSAIGLGTSKVTLMGKQTHKKNASRTRVVRMRLLNPFFLIFKSGYEPYPIRI